MRNLKESPGYIYIISNPSMPGLVKIGRTSRDPQTRLRELNSATGVPAGGCSLDESVRIIYFHFD